MTRPRGASRSSRRRSRPSVAAIEAGQGNPFLTPARKVFTALAKAKLREASGRLAGPLVTPEQRHEAHLLAEGARHLLVLADELGAAHP